ncbi:MAG: DUF3035 domain-containing protein [Marinovum sp.]|nr:DUF3035 domain-containing protein [Marinovum sp.]
MKSRRPVLPLAILCAALTVSACGDRDISLRLVRNASEGPEEFGVVPTRELQLPDDLAALPTPTPEGTNLADPLPNQAAVAALGGNPSRLTLQGGVPSSDASLVNYAGRYGVSSQIREELAEVDLEFRRRRSLFTWKLVPEDEYNRVYRSFRLDPYREAARFQRSGIKTPAAPPEQR